MIRELNLLSKIRINFISSIRTYIPRRAVLYVPGDDERKINKTKQLNVDCIAFDCEDGVALNRKSNARETIRNFFETNPISTSTEYAVRINSVNTEFFEDDIHTLFNKSKSYPKTIFLPKINKISDIKRFSELLEKNMKECSNTVNLIMYTESCESVMNLPKLCEAAFDMGLKKGLFKPVGIVFGSDDFCASLGAIRSENSIEILHARQRVVLIAKAFELQAIDMVYIDFKDEIGLKKQSDEGARYGYTGKQIIHPQQINIVQKSFSPSQKQLDWALDLIKAFNHHQNTGKGAFVHNNRMIDMPTVRQAMNIVDINKKVKN